jgi:hypothetical protein
MTAPERIWATWKEDFGSVQIGTWADTVRFEPLGTEYVRADLPPPLSAALALPEIAALVEAARLFGAAVFNDNGDVTISTGHLKRQDWLRLNSALAALQEKP